MERNAIAQHCGVAQSCVPPCDKAILGGDDLKSFLQFALGNNSLK
jgi:hypothetical protein